MVPQSGKEERNRLRRGTASPAQDGAPLATMSLRAAPQQRNHLFLGKAFSGWGKDLDRQRHRSPLTLRLYQQK